MARCELDYLNAKIMPEAKHAKQNILQFTSVAQLFQFSLYVQIQAIITKLI